MKTYQEIKRCYDLLEDEVSKKLFIARLDWNLSGDDSYLEPIVECLSPKLRNIGLSDGHDFSKSFNYMASKIDNENERIVVYGLGLYGKTFIENFENKSKLTICDKKICSRLKEYKGINVISREELLMGYPSDCILITTLKYEDEIVNDLLSAGIDRNKIVRLSHDSRIADVDEHNQYFEDGIISPKEREIFVDCGFFRGETTKRFIEWCNGDYEHIYAFEPNSDNIEKSLIDKSSIKNLSIINKGVWEDTRELRMVVTDRGDSCFIDDEGSEIVQVTSIDDILNGKRVTFIKMDVEGAEMMALRGAQYTIERYHPRLAICIYHKPEDIIEIQRYILSINEEYRFYIRQYSNYTNEMVLYAI